MKSAFKFLLLSICVLFVVNASSQNNKRLVVIEAGHGGHDYGAVVDEIKEKDIVRKIVDAIAKANRSHDYEFIVIGQEDKYFDLKDRVDAINLLNPELVISIHLSASSNEDDSGIKAFVSAKNLHHEKAREIAASIVNNLDRNNKATVISQDLYVLKNVNCPAIMLDLGYLSNKNDRAKLTSDDGLRKIGENINLSLSNY